MISKELSVVVRRILLVGFVVIVFAAAVAWYVGGALSAPVPRVIGPPPAVLVADTVTFTSQSGSIIHGWFSRGSTGQGAVLLLHGVRGDRRDMLSRAEFLHGRGFTVLLIDFQAHGESPGKRITFGDLESRDVVAALQFLRRSAPGERVGVIGVSLGAAAFVLAEGRPPVDAVVLESMYPTLEQAVADRLQIYLGRWGSALSPVLLMQVRVRLGIDADRLRPIDRIGDIHAPLLLVHGTLDQHTPIAEAQAVYAAASEPKEWWAIEGAGHVSLYRFASVGYERRVGEFLMKYLRLPPR